MLVQRRKAPLLQRVVFPTSSFSVGKEQDAGSAAAQAVFHSSLRGLAETSWRVMAAALPGRHC